jgi:hypothetical protein
MRRIGSGNRVDGGEFEEDEVGTSKSSSASPSIVATAVAVPTKVSTLKVGGGVVKEAAEKFMLTLE